MKYFEAPLGEPGGRQLCRVENFLQFHAGFDALLRGERLIGILSELMGEPAVLFKEKINFKLPGGNGFLGPIRTHRPSIRLIRRITLP